MTLTIYDHTSAITVTATPEQAMGLLGDLPAGVQVRVRPDDPPHRVLSTRVPSTCTTCGAELGGGVPMGCSRPEACPDCGAYPQPKPPGYFGLAVALAHDTWATTEADRVEALHAEYQAYLRGERPDPRD